jgi:hypothetical protein
VAVSERFARWHACCSVVRAGATARGAAGAACPPNSDHEETIMKTCTWNQLLQGLVIGLTVPTLAVGAAMTAGEYGAVKDRATAEYKTAKARCDSLAGHGKDVCVAEAKAAETKAKAEAEAEYRNTDKARRDARIEMAEADYDVAKARCGAKTGNDKDVCLKEAKAAEIKAKADANATEKVAAVRRDAAEEKLEADYKVALEKCDALAGAAKDACVNNARAQYRK